jgi:hypothetical protein
MHSNNIPNRARANHLIHDTGISLRELATLMPTPGSPISTGISDQFTISHIRVTSNNNYLPLWKQFFTTKDSFSL